MTVHMILLIFHCVTRENMTDNAHTMRTAPFAFGSLFKFRFKADQMISSRTSVTQDDFTALLTHFTVVLMVSLRTQHSTQTQTLTNHSTQTHTLTNHRDFTALLTHFTVVLMVSLRTNHSTQTN